MAAVVLAAPVVDDLRRAGPTLASRLLGELAPMETPPDPGVPLVDGRLGYRVLQFRDLRGRAVYEHAGGVVTVWLVWLDGARRDGDAYDEALRHMRRADPSEQVALARILQRLARITGVRPVPPEHRRDPVPEWLAEAMTAAGVPPLEVAALDARAAFARWNELLRSPP